MGIEICLNLPVFEWAMLGSYVLFIDDADGKRAARWLRKVLLGDNLPPAVDTVASGASGS